MAFKFCIVMEILSCRGGTGPSVSMLVFYYKNPCSNPAEVYSLVCKMLFEKNGTKQQSMHNDWYGTHATYKT